MVLNLKVVLIFVVATGVCFSETLSKSELNLEVIQAKEDAQRDAGQDVNSYGWFIGGALIGGTIGTAYIMVDQSDEPNCDIFVAGNAAYILYNLYIVSSLSVPPADRFMGKSPEYIVSYISNYNSRVKRNKLIASLVGCLSGSCLLIIVSCSVYGWKDSYPLF